MINLVYDGERFFDGGTSGLPCAGNDLSFRVICPESGFGWVFQGSYSGGCDGWSVEAGTCEAPPFPWDVPIHVNFCCGADGFKPDITATITVGTC